MFSKLAFVDLETTGSTAQHDRITEIGIVLVDENGVSEWSSLIDPERPIPPMIQSLTGISNAMVAGAPRFREVAAEVAQRLEGRLFIAHNARFDEGFLRGEFERLGMAFRPEVLCTVRLSRKLYPQHPRHNLDSLIQRHALSVSARHRALGDAQLLWQFWQIIGREFPAERLLDVAMTLAGRPRWPEWLDPALPDQLPDAHGVYVFYNGDGLPLYVGRGPRLRAAVIAHFQAGPRTSAKALRLAQQTRRIEWTATGGPVGSQLEQARLIRELAPSHNRRAARRADGWQPWPYGGAIGIREGAAIHVVRDWQFLGSATRDDELWGLLDARADTADYEVYRILRDQLALLQTVDLTPRGVDSSYPG